MENRNSHKSYDTSYQADFDKSLSTLEDIQLLSEFSLSPLIGRAYFHLSEMKRKADEVNLGLVANYDAVAKVLDEKFESIFTDFFSNKSKFKKIAGVIYVFFAFSFVQIFFRSKSK